MARLTQVATMVKEPEWPESLNRPKWPKSQSGHCGQKGQSGQTGQNGHIGQDGQNCQKNLKSHKGSIVYGGPNIHDEQRP